MGIGLAVPDPEVLREARAIFAPRASDPRNEDSRDVATVTIGVTDFSPSPAT
jgi:hypothetical protein